MRGLIQRLRNLGAAAERALPNLNRGGCGVYAAAVALRLEELGIPSECVVPAWNVSSVAEARGNLNHNGGVNTARDWAEAGVCWYHVGVRFKHGGRWYTHDSQATRQGRVAVGDDLAFDATPDGLTPHEMWGAAQSQDGWNATFNRKRGIPEVQRLVWEFLQ